MSVIVRATFALIGLSLAAISLAAGVAFLLSSLPALGAGILAFVVGLAALPVCVLALHRILGGGSRGGFA